MFNTNFKGNRQLDKYWNVFLFSFCLIKLYRSFNVQLKYHFLSDVFPNFQAYLLHFLCSHPAIPVLNTLQEFPKFREQQNHLEELVKTDFLLLTRSGFTDSDSGAYEFLYLPSSQMMLMLFTLYVVGSHKTDSPRIIIRLIVGTE